MHKLHFDNWTSFLTEASTGISPVEGDRRASRSNSKSFMGVETYEEAVDLGRKGWPEGVKQALAIAEPIQEKLYSVVQVASIRYDVTGELLDVGRFASGEPEHWGNWEHTLQEGKGTKYVHVVMNGTASAGVDASVLIARGAVTAALINLLELAGCRVQVTLAYNVQQSGTERSVFQVTVALKQYEEPLDLDRLTYALAHPSAFRCHMFSLMECQSPELREKMGVPHGGYGRQGDVSKEEQGDIYLPKMSYDEDQWSNQETATKWTMEQLQKQGVIQAEPVAS